MVTHEDAELLANTPTPARSEGIAAQSSVGSGRRPGPLRRNDGWAVCSAQGALRLRHRATVLLSPLLFRCSPVAPMQSHGRSTPRRDPAPLPYCSPRRAGTPAPPAVGADRQAGTVRNEDDAGTGACLGGDWKPPPTRSVRRGGRAIPPPMARADRMPCARHTHRSRRRHVHSSLMRAPTAFPAER